ncbi:HINT domain-containing protein [Saccharibacillus sp. JS10]|nr:HINT domain-containing protein [Saccharibacillus sp. JS10]
MHVGDQVIESTYNHPFWVVGKGWVFVKDLKTGDLLEQSDGKTLEVGTIEVQKRQTTVYNMTVEGFHTYFVSGLGIWVHNDECDPSAIKNVYNSIKNAPKYPAGFKAIQNGTKKNNVKNVEVLDALREIESGKWDKIYKDGYDANRNKVSIHYFQSQSGKVFDVKTKSGWSNQ